MENASKALIIAGAILIAILLIGVGVMVMRGASAPVEQAQDVAASQAIEIFNSKFTGYAGKQSAATVKALATAIESSNAVNDDRKIEIEAGSFASTFSLVQANANNQKKYTVTFTYTDGYIKNVKIEEL